MNIRNPEPLVSPVSKTASSGRISNAFEKFAEMIMSAISIFREHQPTAYPRIPAGGMRPGLKYFDPSVLRNCDSASRGSFERIGHFDDIDLFFPLECAGLCYFRNGPITTAAPLLDAWRI